MRASISVLSWALVSCATPSRPEMDASRQAPAPARTEKAPHEERELPPGADADTTGACAEAFADQRQLYVDADAIVHADREAHFLELCRALPAAMQRCASPLYQIEHEPECERVKQETGTPAARTWLQLFDVLSRPEDELAMPHPRPTPR